MKKKLIVILKNNMNEQYLASAIEQNLIRKVNKKKSSNIAKHMRIANATTGAEREKHLLCADKLLSRYTTDVDINN